MCCDEYHYPSGALYARIDAEKREYFYENGVLKTVIAYKEGEFDGEAILYWPNGQMKRKCCFERGKRIHDQFWDCDGRSLS